jgi:hypothetical protein
MMLAHLPYRPPTLLNITSTHTSMRSTL